MAFGNGHVNLMFVVHVQYEPPHLMNKCPSDGFTCGISKKWFAGSQYHKPGWIKSQENQWASIVIGGL
jgi:hypothetical protein